MRFKGYQTVVLVVGDVVECYVDRHTQNSLEKGELPWLLLAKPEPSSKLEGGAVFALY